MSPVTRSRLVRWIAPLVIGAGGLMGLARWTYEKTVAEPLAEKLDVNRYVADSINRSRDFDDIKALSLDILCSKTVDPDNRRCHATIP